MVNRGTYLGVLFGNDVSITDVYKKSLLKFEERVHSYLPILRKVSLHKRITIINIFIFIFVTMILILIIIIINEMLNLPYIIPMHELIYEPAQFW